LLLILDGSSDEDDSSSDESFTKIEISGESKGKYKIYTDENEFI